METESKNVKIIYCKLPYLEERHRNLRNKIKVINNYLKSHKIEIKSVFKTLKTKDLFKNKDVIPQTLKSEVVYSYNCGHCENVYVGETSRHLATRINEHLNAQPVPSEISPS